MEINNAQRKQALDVASETQLMLYGDPESGAKLGSIGDRYTGTINDYGAFAIAIGDVILGLVPQEKLPDLLIERLQITRPEAMKVTADVLDFLAPLSDPQATTRPAPAAVVTPSATTTAPAVSNEALAAEIAQAEAALDSVVQPMRTMAHDMEVVQQPHEAVHQSADQSELLGATAKNPDASWDTTNRPKS